MLNRLPRWVWLGGALLAGVAGMINAAGLLGVQHHGFSHLTGNAAAVGTYAAERRGWMALHFVAILASFVVGAGISGIVIHDATLRLGRRYSAALLIESALLAVSIPLMVHGHVVGDYLITAACGLQNAMATTYSGAVIRTTHVTGLFTDIGILLGHFLRGEALDRKRLTLLSALAIGFILGSAAGAWLFLWLGYGALWVPVAITWTSAVGYLWLHQRELRKWTAAGTIRS